MGRTPMPALVAVMFIVSIGTFGWNSIRNIRRHPLTSSTAIVTTVAVVVATHAPSAGVLVGVLVSGIFFAAKVQSMFKARREVARDGSRATHFVASQIFFASVDRFTRSFQADESAPDILIDESPRNSGISRVLAPWARSSPACLARAVLWRSSATTVRAPISTTNLHCMTRRGSSLAPCRTYELGSIADSRLSTPI